MKITFEGPSLYDIFDQMKYVLQVDHRIAALTPTISADAAVAVALKARPPKKEPVEEPLFVDKPVHKPVEKKPRTEKQLANDERMRVAALERIAARRAAKAERPSEPVKKLVEKFVAAVQDAPEATPFEEPEVDPAEIVKLRTRTIEELQVAYADGHHKEVLELLSRFGNGAKSFRELPPESFVPIRQAIDNGALT